MAQPILCPQVGQDLTEAKVVALHVKLGDTVKKGDIVAEVESEKASFEVEAFASGTVIALPYKVGDTATVLEPLVVLGTPGEVVVDRAESAGATTAKSVSTAGADSKKVSQHRPALDGVSRSSPLARRIAAEAGIELAALAGTGPKGAVVLRDVEEALAKGGTNKRHAASVSGKGGLNIRSLKNGTGQPVVFIHGFGSDLSSWRPFIALLSIGNPLIGIDLPGHGGSIAETADGFDALCNEVAASLKAAGHKRVHLVGHSLGAAVCAALSYRDDIDARSLTLLAPAGLGPKIDGDFIAGFLGASSEAALAQWMKRLVYTPSALPQSFVRASLTAREGTGLVDAQARLVSSLFEGSTQLFSITEPLHHFDGPCRIIVGRRDTIIPASQIDAVSGNVAVHRLESVGHLPHVESAELVARLVAETIRSAG